MAVQQLLPAWSRELKAKSRREGVRLEPQQSRSSSSDAGEEVGLRLLCIGSEAPFSPHMPGEGSGPGEDFCRSERQLSPEQKRVGVDAHAPGRPLERVPRKMSGPSKRELFPQFRVTGSLGCSGEAAEVRPQKRLLPSRPQRKRNRPPRDARLASGPSAAGAPFPPVRSGLNHRAVVRMTEILQGDCSEDSKGLERTVMVETIVQQQKQSLKTNRIILIHHGEL